MPENSDLNPFFDDDGHLTAPRYQDRYFSQAGGLSEAAHVFLEGNRLTQRFEQVNPQRPFVIGETGFGTGLNFLACWQHFDKYAPPDATLHFFSIEKHPLPRDVVRLALAAFPSLREYAYRLLKRYERPNRGTNRFVFADGRVTLSLHVGEAAQALSQCETPADAWLLDGFAPSRNPAMWSPEVLAQVARLSRPGTTLATYTAAGFVRRGLMAVGFDIEKRSGFGTKRDMTVGRLPSPSGTEPPREALVIGAGVAGSFVARALADRGWAIKVADRQPLDRGEWPTLRKRIAVVQPVVTDRDDPHGRFLRTGFEQVEHSLSDRFGGDPRVGWRACGVFHAATDSRRRQRLERFVEQLGPEGLCRWIEPSETREELGVDLPVGGVVIDRAGILRPAGICAALLDHPRITTLPCTAIKSLRRDGERWRAEVHDAQPLHSRVVIVASAMDAKQLEPTAHLDLIPVRGQASLIPTGIDDASDNSAKDLHRVLCFDRYLTPAVDGRHTLGASFVMGDETTDWRDAEHTETCRSLEGLLPDLAQAAAQDRMPTGWVGVRCTTPTRQPYAGQVTHNGRRQLGLYTSLGHGSHGIVSAQHSAALIADTIASREPSAHLDSIKPD